MAVDGHVTSGHASPTCTLVEPKRAPDLPPIEEKPTTHTARPLMQPKRACHLGPYSTKPRFPEDGRPQARSRSHHRRHLLLLLPSLSRSGSPVISAFVSRAKRRATSSFWCLARADSDPHVAQFEPYRVVCTSRDEWIRLHQTLLIAPFLGMLIVRAALCERGTLFYIPLSLSLLNALQSLTPDLLQRCHLFSRS